jgi:5S rRNA maturation endonuclease (ribonuclease M5)
LASVSTAYDKIIDALRDKGLTVREGGDKAIAQCPAHDDRNPSLAIGHRRDGDGAVINCLAGCDRRDVLAAINKTDADLFDNPKMRDIYSPARTYTYPGNRVVKRTPNKDFYQFGNKSDRSLFGSDKITDATTDVLVVEGEKDVEAVQAAGGIAVSPPQGAGKNKQINNWDWSVLDSKNVIIVADNDDVGLAHAAKIAEHLQPIASTVKIVTAAVGKDFADQFAADKSLDELVEVQSEEQVPARRSRITWASDIEPEPVVWAWQENGDHGRIPAGSLSVAAGREGTGKSSFGIWMAAQITRGTLPGSFYGKPLKVLYVAVEDSWKYTLVPRLMAAGADLSMIGRFEVISDDDEELTLSLPYDNALLENDVRHHDVALVVIDPLMSVIGEKIDTHREREVRSALDPLARIADRTGSVILGIAHFNKGSSTDAASLITGSGAFKNVPRSVFGFARDEADDNGGRVMTQVKNSLGRDDLASLAYRIESTTVPTKKGVATTGKFVFLGESERSVADILRDSRSLLDEYEVAARGDTEEWLDKYLLDNGGFAEAKTVIAAGEASGYSGKTIKNVRSKVAKHKREGFGKGSKIYWIHRSSDIEPSTGPIDPGNQKPVPMGPKDGPMGESPRRLYLVDKDR